MYGRARIIMQLYACDSALALEQRHTRVHACRVHWGVVRTSLLLVQVHVFDAGTAQQYTIDIYISRSVHNRHRLHHLVALVYETLQLRWLR